MAGGASERSTGRDEQDPSSDGIPSRAIPAQTGPSRAAPTVRAGFAARMRLDWWWIVILALCGSFQIYRGAPVDGVFFLVAAVALLTDAAGWLARLDRYPLPRVSLAVQLVLGALAVTVIAFTPQWAILDVIVVAVVGATAVIMAWRDDDPFAAEATEPSAPPDALPDATDAVALRRPVRRAAVLWASVAVFLCLWELASFFLAMPSPQAEFDHPPLSDLIDPVVANPLGRAACAALWLLAGAAFLRRGRRS
ncbi:hypothetical protein HII28_06280 [Planctomonas sp. JC2975]|uniref:hypothetical protein n=1 Tax=Planctomonas sp. JC2975 TaxID=2729626 RepID=UPI00147522EC|nr:hypothetical protein [Planctomonas sp. JC2975]NNC11486.1 hypothetical protein [Planctomonas sp. JC2975]